MFRYFEISKGDAENLGFEIAAMQLPVPGGRGGEGGEQRRGLRTKALMQDLGTRLEC